MNIYLHIEISDRELDSKLLLGTLAASRGHDVIVSDLMGIMKGVKTGTLSPGIVRLPVEGVSPNPFVIKALKLILGFGSHWNPIL